MSACSTPPTNEDVPAPAWASNPPTAPGYYWFRPGPRVRPVPVEVAEVRPGLWWAAGIGRPAVPLKDWPTGEWWGPMEVPK